MDIYEARINSHLGCPKVENIADILRVKMAKCLSLLWLTTRTERALRGAIMRVMARLGWKRCTPNKHIKFSTFIDSDNDGFPDNPNAEIALAVHFANYPDYNANYKLCEKPTMPTIKQNGAFVANPNLSGEHYTGNIPRNEDQEVHSADDVILTAEGVGSEYFRGVMDNAEIYFLALLMRLD